MYRHLVLLLSLIICAPAAAQEIRTEVSSPAGAMDSKPNSDAVPDVYSVGGRFERVFVIRMKNKTDILSGLENAVTANHIRNAVILAGTGSVTSYHYHVVSNSYFPTRNIFVKNPDSPADIVSMNGYIVDGRVHAHATFTGAGKAFGGHLEPGTTVFTFAIVTVGVLPDSADLGRMDDKNYR